MDGGLVFRDSEVSGIGERSRPIGVVTCFSCGEKEHRSTECRKGSGTRPSVSGLSVRPITCFCSGKSGHRSVECPNRKVVNSVNKENVGRVLNCNDKQKERQCCMRTSQRS